jgi:multidrug efflux pump subunit AcrA (membrane-fusion protein)
MAETIQSRNPSSSSDEVKNQHITEIKRLASAADTATTEYYRELAPHVAALVSDHGMTYREIAQQVERSKSWVSSVMTWHLNGYIDKSPFDRARALEDERREAEKAREIRVKAQRLAREEANRKAADRKRAEDESRKAAEIVKREGLTLDGIYKMAAGRGCEIKGDGHGPFEISPPIDAHGPHFRVCKTLADAWEWLSHRPIKCQLTAEQIAELDAKTVAFGSQVDRVRASDAAAGNNTDPAASAEQRKADNATAEDNILKLKAQSRAARELAYTSLR